MGIAKLTPDAGMSDDDFGEWIEAQGWKLVDGQKDDAGHVLVWEHPGDATRARLITRVEPKVRYLVMEGVSADAHAADWSRDEDLFWPADALLSSPFHAKDDQTKARAIYWLAASAPPHFDGEYYKVFSGMFGWPSAEFRIELVKALGLVEWPEIGMLLENAREQEEDERVVQAIDELLLRKAGSSTDPGSGAELADSVRDIYRAAVAQSVRSTD